MAERFSSKKTPLVSASSASKSKVFARKRSENYAIDFRSEGLGNVWNAKSVPRNIFVELRKFYATMFRWKWLKSTTEGP